MAHCDPEKITSLINHHIPDAKLKTESKEKLVYILPVERTNKFPGNLSTSTRGRTWEQVFTPLLQLSYVGDLDFVWG